MTDSKQIIAEFAEFQQFCKTEYEQGRCTKREAAVAILDKALGIVLSLRMPISPEQDNMYQAVCIN